MLPSLARTILLRCSAAVLGLMLYAAPNVVRADEGLDALLARHLEWRGGHAFQRLTTLALYGNLRTAGLEGSMESIETAAGESLQKVDLGAVQQTEAVGGRSAWTTTPGGQTESVSPDVAEESRHEALLDFPTVFRGAAGAQLSLRADETLDGARWRILRVSFGGKDDFDLFLDGATGAQLGYRRSHGMRTTFVRRSDWRSVEGVRLPFLIETRGSAPEDNARLEVTRVRINRVTPAHWLDRPAVRHKTAFSEHARRTDWMPFELTGSGHIVMEAEVAGVRTPVYLDSGAAATAIDRQFAAAAGIKSRGRIAAKGTGGSDAVSMAGGIDIRLGKLVLRHLTVAVLPMQSLSEAAGERIQVILGKELFNEVLADIDFDHKRIAFERATGYTPPEGASVVALDLNRDGLRTVDVSIEGEAAVPALFDLGNAGALSISAGYWRPRRLDENHPSTVVSTAGVGGVAVGAGIVVRSIGFGAMKFSAVPADLAVEGQSALNSDGTMANLGLEIWRRFRVITDYPDDRLYLLPAVSGSSLTFRKDLTGLALERKRNGFLIRAIARNSPATAHGWSVGDRITRINGEAAAAASDAWRYQPPGTLVTLAGIDASGKAFRRELSLENFY